MSVTTTLVTLTDHQSINTASTYAIYCSKLLLVFTASDFLSKMQEIQTQPIYMLI